MTTTQKQVQIRAGGGKESRQRNKVERQRLAPVVAEYRAQGKSLGECARLLNISHPTVRRIAQEENGEEPVSVLSRDADYVRIVDMIQSGRTIRQVARELECSKNTVKRALDDAGLSARPAPHVDPEQLERAKAFLEDGTGYHEASRSTGISTPTLREHFPGMGMSRSDIGMLAWPLRRIAMRGQARGIDLTDLTLLASAKVS